MADTVASILHLMISEVMKPPAEPGTTTAGDRIILMIANHVSRVAGGAFKAYLKARNAVSRAVDRAAKTFVPGLLAYRWVRDLVRTTLESAMNQALAEAGRATTGTGSQPSHTRMNLDDPGTGGALYPVARDLPSK